MSMFVFRAEDDGKQLSSIRSSFSEQSTGLSDHCSPVWIFPAFPVSGKQTKLYQLIPAKTKLLCGTGTCLMTRILLCFLTVRVQVCWSSWAARRHPESNGKPTSWGMSSYLLADIVSSSWSLFSPKKWPLNIFVPSTTPWSASPHAPAKSLWTVEGFSYAGQFWCTRVLVSWSGSWAKGGSLQNPSKWRFESELSCMRN